MLNKPNNNPDIKNNRAATHRSQKRLPRGATLPADCALMEPASKAFPFVFRQDSLWGRLISQIIQSIGRSFLWLANFAWSHSQHTGSVVRPRKKHLNVRQENTEQSSKLSPPSGRRGSVVSSTTRLTSAVSIRSGKETASDRRSIHGQEDLPGKTRSVTGKTKAKVPSATKDTAVKGRKVSEIQVIELEVPDERDATQDADLKGRSKLLANRSQQKKRVIPVDQRSSKEARKVPLDAISCISDYSAISNIDYSPQKTTTRRGRPGAATPLTSKSLKDFTNSPEGKYPTTSRPETTVGFNFLTITLILVCRSSRREINVGYMVQHMVQCWYR